MIVDFLGRQIDYKPYKERLYENKMILRIIGNRSFRRVFMPKYNLTDKFIADMRDVINPEHKFTENTIWVMSGETGTGKSSAIMSLLRLIMQRRGIWQLFCFTDKQLLDLADQFGDNIFLVRDEDVASAVHGEGSMRTQMQLEVLVETCRVAGISVVFISPTELDTSVAKYYLETVDMDLNQRITRLALKDAHTKIYLGTIFVPIIPTTDNDWIQYTAMKNEFIKDMRQGKIGDTKTDINGCVETVLGKLDTDTFRTKGERKTLVQQCFPNFTIGEVKTIATMLEIRLRQGWSKSENGATQNGK